MVVNPYLRKELPFRQLFLCSIFNNFNYNNNEEKRFYEPVVKACFQANQVEKKESAIAHFGHMSFSVFNHQDPANELSLSHFLRIMINYAMVAEHTDKVNEFMVYWTKLGIELQVFAESSDVDEFNKQFASESKSHSKHPTHF